MAQSQLATRIESRVKRAVEAICAERGLKLNRFVEQALLDKLEELSDIDDVKRIRFEPTKPLSQVLKKLKLDGEL